MCKIGESIIYSERITKLSNVGDIIIAYKFLTFNDYPKKLFKSRLEAVFRVGINPVIERNFIEVDHLLKMRLINYENEVSIEWVNKFMNEYIRRMKLIKKRLETLRVELF